MDFLDFYHFQRKVDGNLGKTKNTKRDHRITSFSEINQGYLIKIIKKITKIKIYHYFIVADDVIAGRFGIFLKEYLQNHLKAHRQIKRHFEKYCSRDKACQFQLYRVHPHGVI